MRVTGDWPRADNRTALAEAEIDRSGLHLTIEGMVAIGAVAIDPVKEEMGRPGVRVRFRPSMAVVDALVEDRVAHLHRDRAIVLIVEFLADRRRRLPFRSGDLEVPDLAVAVAES